MVFLKPAPHLVAVHVNLRSNEKNWIKINKKKKQTKGEGHCALILSTGRLMHQMGNGVQEDFFNYYLQPLFDHLTSTPDEVMLSRMNSH